MECTAAHQRPRWYCCSHSRYSQSSYRFQGNVVGVQTPEPQAAPSSVCQPEMAAILGRARPSMLSLAFGLRRGRGTAAGAAGRHSQVRRVPARERAALLFRILRRSVARASVKAPRLRPAAARPHTQGKGKKFAVSANCASSADCYDLIAHGAMRCRVNY
eukprot:5364620-Prymnesium_polylepis.1